MTRSVARSLCDSWASCLWICDRVYEVDWWCLLWNYTCKYVCSVTVGTTSQATQGDAAGCCCCSCWRWRKHFSAQLSVIYKPVFRDISSSDASSVHVFVDSQQFTRCHWCPHRTPGIFLRRSVTALHLQRCHWQHPFHCYYYPHLVTTSVQVLLCGASYVGVSLFLSVCVCGSIVLSLRLPMGLSSKIVRSTLS